MRKQSQDFLENAQNCAELAERAPDEPTHKRYKRMEAAGARWQRNNIGLTERSRRKIA